MRLLLATVIGASVVGAQTHHPPVGQEGSPNIHVVGHIPLGGDLHVTDIDIEQELARPYVYVSRGVRQPAGFSIISVRDIKHGQADPQLLYEWNIENPELHVGLGALRGRYFKTHGRYYYVQCFQFSQGTPDADLGAIVFDVTGLPDTSKIKEVARIRQPDAPGGFHDVFTYKHSDGRVLLFTSTSAKPYAQIWDMDKLLAGAPNYGFVGRVTNPDRLAQNDHSIVGSFHDYWLGYDPATQQDKFYGAGRGGYYVFDVTKPEEPKLITSITGVMGVTSGHTITPSPDGRYAVTETEVQYEPLRIFDLQPGLEKKVQTISQPIGAWTADWRNLAHNHEVRWPYVFVSAYEDGLQVFNMLDPTDPYTMASYHTFSGGHQTGCCSQAFIADPSQDPAGHGVENGAFGVQVRDADGLIVISDMTTGFWAFYMDGFDGWNGHQWGMPNVSTAQHWDTGPESVPPRRPVQ
ncbi:MAG TPA: hypothetical protein VFA43_19345 [Gemmatimonadaceae bacterium]|nr:hypothetical protein [Gemmatimonadaceae bacterium]